MSFVSLPVTTTATTNAQQSGSNRRHTLAPVSSSEVNSIRGRPSLGPQRTTNKPQQQQHQHQQDYKTPTKPSAMPTLPSSSSITSSTISSSKKAGRKSVGGNSSRMSIGTSMSGIMGGLSASAMSEHRVSMQPRTSLSRRSGVFDKPGPTITKDPRPLNDKSYMANCVQDLLNFLLSNGFLQHPYPITAKTLVSPSLKDFQRIFQFLYLQIDPHFQFGQKSEDEIPQLFKRIKYPFTINKSSLFAVGSLHTWPYLLGALHWLVDLAEFARHCDVTAYVFPAQGDGFSQDAMYNDHQLFFSFLVRAYALFLDGSDDFDELENELKNSFSIRNSAISMEVEKLTSIRNSQMNEIEQHRNRESPVEVLEKRRQDFVSDKEKLVKFVQNLESHKVNHERKLGEHNKELEARLLEYKELVAEKDALQEQFNKQELSLADVERISQERFALFEANKIAVAAKEEADKLAWEREMQASKKIEELEKVVFAFNKAFQQVPRPQEAGIEADFEFKLNFASATPEQIASIDIKAVLLPSLSTLKEQVANSILLAEEQQSVLSDKQEQLSEQIAEKNDELSQLEDKVAKTETLYQEKKEVLAKEHKQRASGIESFEQQLQDLRVSVTDGLQDSERSLKKARSEFELAAAQCDQEKQEFNQIIFRTIDMVAAHKASIQERVSVLKAFALKTLKATQAV